MLWLYSPINSAISYDTEVKAYIFGTKWPSLSFIVSKDLLDFLYILKGQKMNIAEIIFYFIKKWYKVLILV